ncbi:MAG: methyl-accepting chemotaxis protein, partial [Desulfatirhabdiaceae bacterium]
LVKGVSVMKWFVNLSTRAKLFLGFGIMWLLLAVTIATAFRSIVAITESEIKLSEFQFIKVIDLRELQSNQNYNRGQLLEMILTTDSSGREAISKNIQERSRNISEIIERLLKLDPHPHFQGRLAELQKTMDAYRLTREQQIVLIQEGKIEEVKQLAVSVQDERFDKIRSIAMELGQKTSEEINRQIGINMETARTIKLVFTLVGIAAFLLGSLMIAFLNQTIAKPLRALTDIAKSIAAGDLNITAAVVERKDEVGLLVQAFERMTQSLRDMAAVAAQIASGDLRVNVNPQSEKDVLGKSFLRMLEILRRSTADIAEAVNLLSSSASEILAATTQVAAGSAETATAISETTTTVEEVRQAAQLSSQKAKHVSDSAQRVAQVSQTGQKAVEEAAAGMRQIRAQMDSITKTIVRLSEQGQSIGGIIASVTDLADQSNLLAVNAAIEAARAGEQGKGFAVVAQEIRSLAEQSRQATAQVRDILSDIQKATGAAVMATEQGSKAVDAGVKQSTQAGETIRALADSIREALQAATQIAASSQQQVVGMDQIGMAMENINQAGGQTAASMKQSETAAKGLYELGQKLKQLVEQYKV